MVELSTEEGRVRKAIRACLRIRPLNRTEETRKSKKVLHAVEPKKVILDDEHSAPYEGELDAIFDETCSQEEVFNGTCSTVPQQLLGGFDCAILAYGPTGTGKTYTFIGKQSPDEEGLISRVVRGLFERMNSSPPEIEFTVRCSVVEVYLDRIRDLIVESSKIHLDDGWMRGCSRLSCLDAADVINIVNRAHSVRTSSAVEPNRDSSRSSMLIQIEVEQYNSRSQNAKRSKLFIGDLVGSEYSSLSADEGLDSNYADAVTDDSSEAKMVSKSLLLLRRMLEEHKSKIPVTMPESAPALARILSNCIGGNFCTTFLLTASPSDLSIRETINTLNFGKDCRLIENTPFSMNFERWQDNSERFAEVSEDNNRLRTLVESLADECRRFQLKSGARYSTVTVDNVIHDVLAGKTEDREIHFTIETKAEHQIRTERMKLKSEARRANQSCKEAISGMDQMKSDLRILGAQNTALQAELNAARPELDTLRSELRSLRAQQEKAQRAAEVSRFRENEALIFLRQFRRFYFRLRKKMAADGSGSLASIANSTPGAPDLSGLVEIDKLMVESGLLEEKEIGKDNSTSTKSSTQALLKSTALAEKIAVAEPELASGSVLETESSVDKERVREGREGGTDHSSETTDMMDGAESLVQQAIPMSVLVKESPVFTEARHKYFRTPGGKCIEMREDHLESELLELTEKALQLEKALAEEKEKVEVLTKTTGVAAALERLKSLQETKNLREQLERKDHDLNAVIWKMNEMHVASKMKQTVTLEKHEHIGRLETSLNEVQIKIGALVAENEELEKQFRNKMQVYGEKARQPVWQLDDVEFSEAPFRSRLVAPFAYSDASIKEAQRRTSVGEKGEWVKLQVHRDVTHTFTQTDSLEKLTNESETQTEIQMRISDEFYLDAETQTSPISVQSEVSSADIETQTDADWVDRVATSDGMTQTEAKLLTLKDIELSTIEAATASVPDTNVEDLLFMLDDVLETPEFSSTRPLTDASKTVASTSDAKETNKPAITNFMFMDNDSVETSNAAVESEASPFVSKETEALSEQVSEGVESFATQANAIQDAGQEKILHDIDYDKNDEVPLEASNAKTRKPVSSFIARLQAQAQKHQGSTSTETGKPVVPEFMRKFKTIGARNAKESVIEASGEAPAKDTGSITVPWVPRNSKNDDSDTDSDHDGAPIINETHEHKSGATEKATNESSELGNTITEELAKPAPNKVAAPTTTESVVNDDSESINDELSGLVAEPVTESPVKNAPTHWGEKSTSYCYRDDSASESTTEVTNDDFMEKKGEESDQSDSHSDSSKDEHKDTKPESSHSVREDRNGAIEPLETDLPLAQAKSEAEANSDDSDNDDTPPNKLQRSVPVDEPSLPNTKLSESGDEPGASEDPDISEEKRDLGNLVASALANTESTDGINTEVPARKDAFDESIDGEREAITTETEVPTHFSGTDDSPEPLDITKKLELEIISKPSEDSDDSDSSATASSSEVENKAVLSNKDASAKKTDSDNDADGEELDASKEKASIAEPAPAAASPPTEAPKVVAPKPKVKDSSDESSSESDSDSASDSDSSDEESTTRKQKTSVPAPAAAPVPAPAVAPVPAPAKVSPKPKVKDSSDESSLDSNDDSNSEDDSDVPRKKAPALQSAVPKPPLAAKTPTPEPKWGTKKPTNDSSSDDDSSDDSSENSDDDESKKMLQGGKSTNFTPKRKVMDFGAKLNPAVSTEKASKAKDKQNKDSVEKSQGTGKFVIKSGKLVKDDASAASKSTSKSKKASGKSSKGNSGFAIKNGKLVKNEKAPKGNSPAFKIVGGKLVKQDEGTSATVTKKKGGKKKK